MNPSILFHLVKKDFRVLRGWLLALWILLALEYFLPLQTESLFVYLFGIITFALVFFAQWRLFQIDPIIGGNHFLQTRPISRTSLLASKFLLWFFAMILPLTLTHAFYLLRYSLGINAIDYALLFVEWFVYYAAMFSVLLIPAQSARNLGSLLFYSIGFLGGVWLLGVITLHAHFLIQVWQFFHAGSHFSFSSNHHPHIFHEYRHSYDGIFEQHLATSRDFIALVVEIFASLITIFRFYQTRRFSQMWLPVIIGFSAVWIVLFALKNPRWNFVHRLAQKPLTAKKSDWPNPSQIRFSFQGNPEFINTHSGESSLALANAISGLPTHWWMRQWNYKSKTTFPSDKNWTLSEDSRYDADFQTQGSQSDLEMLGLSPLPADVHPSTTAYSPKLPADFRTVISSSVNSYDLLEQEDKNDLAGQKAKVIGRATFKFWRPELVRAMPLRNGETFLHQHHRWTIQKIRLTANGLALTLLIETPEMKLRPLYTGWDGMPLRILLINRDANETLHTVLTNHDLSQVFGEFGGRIMNNQSFGDYNSCVEEFDYARPNHQKIDAAYLAGLKLYIIDYEYGGDFSVPFDVQSVELKR